MRRTPFALALTLAALGIMGTFSSASFGAARTPEAKWAYGPVTYNDLNFGEVTCRGQHQINAAYYPGTETSGGRDSYACQSSVKHGLLSGVTPGQSISCYCSVEGQEAHPIYYWYSDDPAMNGAAASQVKGTVSKTGHSYHAIAYYPQA